MENRVHSLQPPQVRVIYSELVMIRGVTDYSSHWMQNVCMRALPSCNLFSGCCIHTDVEKRFLLHLLFYILISSYLKGFDLFIVNDFPRRGQLLLFPHMWGNWCQRVPSFTVKTLPFQLGLAVIPAKGPQCNRTCKLVWVRQQQPSFKVLLEHK